MKTDRSQFVRRTLLLGATVVLGVGSRSVAQKLDRIEISGPTRVAEERQGRYACVAFFDDGQHLDVTEFVAWSVEKTPAASIRGGVLTTPSVESDREVRVCAEYALDDFLAADALDVLILNVRPAGYALAFDGLDDLVLVARHAALEPEEITVEVWVRIDGPQRWHSRIVRKLGEPGGGGYLLTAQQYPFPNITMRFAQDTFFPVDPSSYDRLIGGWHHIAGVYGREENMLMIDGIVVDTWRHAPAALCHDLERPLVFGNLASQAEGFNGAIDEVRIWGVARGPEEIGRTMYKSLDGDEPGLVGYWRFDEGRGQVAHDSSVHGNHGWLGRTDNPAGERGDPRWIVSGAPVGRAGVVDVNADGVVDRHDFLLFVDLLVADDLRADFDRNRTIDSRDYRVFLDAYLVGR